MRAAALTAGLQSVGARCRGTGSGDDESTVISVRIAADASGAPLLTCAWELPVHTFHALARLDVGMPAISALELLPVEGGKTLARVSLVAEPRVAIGTRAAARPTGRRARQKRAGATHWLPDASHGNAALPPLLRSALLRERSIELLLLHDVQEARERLGPALRPPARRACEEAPAASPVVGWQSPRGVDEERTPAQKPGKAAAWTPTKLAQPDELALPLTSDKKRVIAALAEKEERGSNGEQCDWCGMTPADGDAALKVCGACHYSSCEECSQHKTKGTCYCGAPTRRRRF
ncbi:unnamed protein product [Prorocentrum cordatum]|uniref:Uncharacterized protein n=1 Tax=Prorocentrum cordatum TaxID=2364126 RepID=A0ABN9STJ5_9DINO|nr:unnamed protein product [Polarella glacialis]